MGLSSWLALRVKVGLIRLLAVIVPWYYNVVLRIVLDWQIAEPKRSREYTIPSLKGDRRLKIRVWDPPAPKNGLRPVHLNFHGSGFMVPSLGVDSDFCQLLASTLNITVLDCDYAKAPEHPFPAAYEDCAAIISSILSSSPSVYDLSNITIGGFSAGATLSLSVCGTSPIAQANIKAVVAMYPSVDHSIVAPSPGRGPPGSTGARLPPSLLTLFWTNYVPPSSGYEMTDPRISPAFVKPSDMPRKMCIIRAEHDNLRWEADAFVEKMKQGGVEVCGAVIKDVNHGWDKTAIRGSWEEERKKEAYALVLDFLNEVYAS